MINKKRVNKVTKLTVASAIAFSALAQPLGNFITVKAAEAPETTKAENKLLAASRVAQFKNAQFTSTDTSIPDWTPVSFIYDIYTQKYDFTSLTWSKSGNWFNGIYGLNGASIMPDGVGGFQIQAPNTIRAEGGMEQIIDTIPGEKYTINFKSDRIRGPVSINEGMPFARVFTGDANDASNARHRIYNSYIDQIPTKPIVASFIATSTKSVVSIGIGNQSNIGAGYTGIFRYSDFSIANSSATTISAPTINAMTDEDTVVAGTGTANKHVRIELADGTILTDEVGTDGKYSVTIPKQSAGAIVKVALYDGEGNVSPDASTTVTANTVVAPTINAVTTDDLVVKGTGISGATVTVTIAGQDRTAIVGQDGNYSVTIPAQAVGTEITAKQSLNGKTSDSVSTTVIQGTVAAPTIDTVATDDTTVKGTGINGATVTVKIGSNEYTATVANNTYSITIPKQAFGTEITAKQSLNNKTSSEVKTTVTQGTVAAPTIDTVTTDDTTVKGTGINGATVTVKVGSQEYTATVTDGKYAIAISKQAFGTEITAKQSLNSKTSSEVKTTVTQGTVAVPTIDAVTTDDTTVKGTGINGATITVKIGSDEYTATVTNNAYSITIPKQAFGKEITVKQSLNSKTSSEVKTTVTQGTVANPTINAVTTDDTTVKGSGINGATVTLTIGGDEYQGTVTNGSYSITIPKQAAGTDIFAKQTLNGKTSDSVSTRVTQGTLAAPTINDYTVGDGYVTGSAPAGATKVALYVADKFIRYADVTAGKYRVYAGDNASMGVAGTAFQVAGVDSSGAIGTKATSTVKPSVTVAAPVINDFYVGDAYAKGTATGASKVTLYIDGVAVRTASVATNGAYSIYTGDRTKLATAGNTFQVEASNAAGKTSTKTTATVKAKLAAPTINDFYAGDAYAKGVAAGGANKVTLYIDGVAVRTAAVAADGTYSIYTGDRAKLATAGNTFQIESSASTGDISTKTTGTVKARIAAPTISDYYATDVYAKGVAPTGATKVALYVKNVFVRYATVTDGKYTIYTGDQSYLTTVGNTFQIAAVDASGNVGTKATGTVKKDDRVAYKLTAGDYNLATNTTVVGTAGGGITRVKIEVDGVVKRQTTVGADGNYAIYAKDVITSTNNTVRIIGLDAQGFECNSVTVSLENETPATYNMTVADYNTAKDNYVTGTADAAITRVKLIVNNIDARSTTTADGKYSIYASDKITSGDTVQIVGLDATGVELARKTVTLK
ncbi:Ig-like domain-containing protein [Listeria booriae]|uniref:Ig-like domain-containing protein n=1 Tax=Listeria booriae TaxID=1552123 RepID=UPI001623F936|nr:Ig-like domain-containing protein [Listeria booriae]MBC2327144.1 hypothetical protein [Listeria booriae]